MKAGKIFGIEIELHFSWFIFFGPLTWAFRGYFAQTVPNNPAFLYWAFGLLTILLLFASILFHEMAHSLVGRNLFKMPFRKITLFMFGGAAQFGESDSNDYRIPSAKAEFWMSLAGPLSSFVLSGTFFGISLFLGAVEISLVSAMVVYLSTINLILGIFNLLPIFPMDGGRIFRSLLWGKIKNLLRATKIAYRVGIGTSFLMPVAAFFWGGVGSILWISLIVFFIIIPAAGAEYESIAKEPLKEVRKINSIFPFIVSLPFKIPIWLIKEIKKYKNKS